MSEKGSPHKRYGLALGVALGVAFGVALGNMGIGIALGVVFGLVFSSKDLYQPKDPGDPPGSGGS